MNKRGSLAIVALVLAAWACSLPDYLPAPAPVIEPTPLPTFSIPTETPIPTETLPPTVTPTPEKPVAWPKDEGVHCRYGPGKEWEAVSAVPAGTTVEIVGRVSETTWWYVEDPLDEGDFCWVAFEVVDTAGDMTVIPIVQPPTASVTEVEVEAAVAFAACGGPNPVTFSGKITANGPTTVTYHWEVGGDKQNVTGDETLTFAEAGTKQLTSDAYDADCGNYFVILSVTSPNELTARQEFSIKAP
ncbi:MAG: hypothetical protein ACOYYJ_03755 [Chloroflexota bacterium]